MPVLSAMVGADLGTCEFEVTARRLLAYAAGLGVTAPQVFDDASERFVGLPQFCVVAEWPWASDPQRMRSLGLTAAEARQALHLGQDSTFLRPIRPGMTLRVGGRLESARATQAGTITVSRIETTDAATGELCVTSRSTALFRGVALQGEPRNLAEDLSRPAAGAAAPEDAHGALVVTEVAIGRELPHVYTECSGIWNPIHTERRVALAMGLPDIVLHGTATWALAGRELSRIHAAGQAQLTRLAGHFRATVIPGTTIRIEHRVATRNPQRVGFTVFNAAGETAIADGLAEFAES